MFTTYLIAIAFAAEPVGPEERAVAFLVREVPRWSADNHCYSCHNNGDAARALFMAGRHSLPVPERALADTIAWLRKPEGWDRNGGEEAPRDLTLARIQFAAALCDAIESGKSDDRAALRRAAQIVAKDQATDGSWKIAAADTIGSPVTYGNILATHLARRTLERADAKKHAAALERSGRWLREVRVKNVLDAAGILLALDGATDEPAREQQRRCLELICKGENKDGGWGPYVNAAAEPFDTALVLLALAPRRDADKIKPLIQRGRGYLLSTQREDGSWPETTRPAGAESYAQRLSTTGWATLALLATLAERGK